jgi:hypothetical protein
VQVKGEGLAASFNEAYMNILLLVTGGRIVPNKYRVEAERHITAVTATRNGVCARYSNLHKGGFRTQGGIRRGKNCTSSHAACDPACSPRYEVKGVSSK